ncbi:MAG TPA: hypothetical protein VMZ29_13910 [Candidatus Bathyarchaeia archaeon]|nr:hypothetical protein [Candidatus Bathyarchaeia archaeon]
MKTTGNKCSNPIKRLMFFSIVFLIITSSLILKTQNDILIVNAVSEEDTYSKIITAYETIEHASQEGLDVTSYVDRLNDALDDYFSEDYTNAYNKAILIIEDVNNDLTNYRRNRILTYIIIPFNLLIVVALIAFLGMKMIKWHKIRSEEEFLDLEIIYPEEESKPEI